MTIMGGDLLACWTTLVSPPVMDDELSLQLIRSGAVALDVSHRPPVVIMVDELRASFRDDGRRMNASGELRRLDDGDDGGRWDGCGGSDCNRARAEADKARPQETPDNFGCLLADECWAGCGTASANLATASMGRAVACNGM